MPLKEFFAVTLSSVYCVSSERNEDGGPTIQKINGSTTGAVKIGELLPAGEHDTVIVTRSGKDFQHNKLHVCHPDVILPKYQICLDVSARTSLIVGLFLDRDDALDCFEVDEKQVYDECWNEDTATTEMAIGFNHPDFQVFDFDCQIDRNRHLGRA